MLLHRSRLPPAAITTLSLLLASGAAAAIAAGRMALGGWLFILAGMCDFLDGRIARETQVASPSGAVLDSVTDRYVDPTPANLIERLAYGWLAAATTVLAALLGQKLVAGRRAKNA